MEFRIIVCPYVHFFHKSFYTHSILWHTEKNCPWNIIYRVFKLGFAFQPHKTMKTQWNTDKVSPFRTFTHKLKANILKWKIVKLCLLYNSHFKWISFLSAQKSKSVCVCCVCVCIFFVLLSLFHSSNRKFHKVINASVWKKLIKFG